MPPQTRLRITVLGSERITKRYTGVALRAGHMEPAFEISAEILMEEFRHQFETEGAYGGAPWERLTEARVERKRREGLSDKILQASQALMDSLTVPGDSNQILIISNSTMVLGSKLKYGKVHDRGSTTSNIPQRQIQTITLKARATIHEVMAAYLVYGGKSPKLPNARVML